MRKLSARQVYLVISFITSLASSIMFTVLGVYYVQQVGMNPLQLVLVGTLLEATIFLLEVPTGVIADTYSRRLSVIIGMFVIGVAFMLEGSLPFFAGVLFAEAIRGVGETFISGATDAWLADEVGEEQLGSVYLRASQVGRAVGLVAPFISVGLASITLSLPIIIGGILYVLLALFLVLYMPETGFQPVSRAEHSTWQALSTTFLTGSKTVRGQRVLLFILLISAVVGAHGEGVDRLWEAHFLTTFSLPAIGSLQPVVWFAIINVGAQVIGIVVTELVRRKVDLSNRNTTARALIVTEALVIIAIISFALAGSFELAVLAFWASSVLRGLAGPLAGTWFNQNISSRARATILSMSSLTNAFGQVTGGPIIGLVGTIYGLRPALVITSLVLTPALWLYARALRLGRQKTSVSQPEEATLA